MNVVWAQPQGLYFRCLWLDSPQLLWCIIQFSHSHRHTDTFTALKKTQHDAILQVDSFNSATALFQEHLLYISSTVFLISFQNTASIALPRESSRWWANRLTEADSFKGSNMSGSMSGWFSKGYQTPICGPDLASTLSFPQVSDFSWDEHKDPNYSPLGSSRQATFVWNSEYKACWDGRLQKQLTPKIPGDCSWDLHNCSRKNRRSRSCHGCFSMVQQSPVWGPLWYNIGLQRIYYYYAGTFLLLTYEKLILSVYIWQLFEWHLNCP